MAPDCSPLDQKPPATLARPNSLLLSSSPANAQSKDFLLPQQWALTSPCPLLSLLLPSSLLAPTRAKGLQPPITSPPPASSAPYYHHSLITVAVKSLPLWTPSKWVFKIYACGYILQIQCPKMVGAGGSNAVVHHYLKRQCDLHVWSQNSPRTPWTGVLAIRGHLTHYAVPRLSWIKSSMTPYN